MSKYLRSLFCLAILILTTCLGCNKNSASASNFEAGLNHYFQNHPECFTLPYPQYALGEQNFLDKLVKIGILTKQKNAADLMGATYNLSDTGRHFVSPSDSSKLCYGNKTVERVVNFTKSGGEGNQESTVTYVWALTNDPDWAKSASDTQPPPNWEDSQLFDKEVKGTLSEKERTATDTMRLTNLGWRRSDDTGQ